MATEDTEEQERLDRILIQVQGGQSISSAVRSERCEHWYYRVLGHAQRALITRARMEYMEAQDPLPDKPTFWFRVTSFERKKDFQQMCLRQGVSVGHKLNSLMSEAISNFKSGL